MKFISYNKFTGDITSYIETSSSAQRLETASTGFIEVMGPIDMEHMYIKEGVLVERESKPFPWYRWDGEKWYNPKTPEQEWESIRAARDALLAKSDWTQLPDVPLATKEAWAAYRQALRDITLQPDPFSITWPQPPQ